MTGRTVDCSPSDPSVHFVPWIREGGRELIGDGGLEICGDDIFTSRVSVRSGVGFYWGQRKVIKKYTSRQITFSYLGKNPILSNKNDDKYYHSLFCPCYTSLFGKREKFLNYNVCKAFRCQSTLVKQSY